MNKTILKYFWLPFALSSALLLSVPSIVHAEQPKAESYIQVQRELWEQLKSNSTLLEAKLIMLQEALTELDRPSSELMSSLIELRLQLETTKQELTVANLSLSNAQNSLKRITELYSRLERRIEEERQAAVKEKRKAYWKGFKDGFFTGAGAAAVGTFIHKR